MLYFTAQSIANFIYHRCQTTEIWVWGSSGIIRIEEKFSVLRTTSPNETYPTPGLIRTGLGLNPGFFGNKPATNCLNTFTAIVDLSRFNNSCLKSPASTLFDLTFQSRALRSFSLNQLRNLPL